MASMPIATGSEVATFGLRVSGSVISALCVSGVWALGVGSIGTG